MIDAHFIRKLLKRQFISCTAIRAGTWVMGFDGYKISISENGACYSVTLTVGSSKVVMLFEWASLLDDDSVDLPYGNDGYVRVFSKPLECKIRGKNTDEAIMNFILKMA
jgi:hypothetical protein